MLHLSRHLRPRMAWSSAFALALVVVIVEIYVLVFFSITSSPAHEPFLWYQNVQTSWYGEGEPMREMFYAFRTVNLLLVGYLWLKCRAMHPRRERLQRLSLVGAALMLVAVQVFHSMYAEAVLLPRFELIRIHP